MTKLQEIAQKLELHNEISYRNLSIFPLIVNTTHSRSYITLADALGDVDFRISEINEGSRVSEVRVENLGPSPVLLLDGEELLGAMQNRILNLTIMVPANAIMNIPVSCVEAGRWSHSSPNFEDAGRTAYSSLRASKMAQVSESLEMNLLGEADQLAIWQDVEDKATRMDALGPTQAMDSMYEIQGSILEEFSEHLQPIPAQCGAIFAINGTVTGMDLYDHPETFRELFPKLLQGYALDAIDQGQKNSKNTEKVNAEAFVSQVATVSDVSSFDAVGLGTDFRFQGTRIIGSALDALDGIVHLCVFELGAPSTYGGDDDGSLPRASRSSLRRSWRVHTTADRK